MSGNDLRARLLGDSGRRKERGMGWTPQDAQAVDELVEAPQDSDGIGAGRALVAGARRDGQGVRARLEALAVHAKREVRKAHKRGSISAILTHEKYTDELRAILDDLPSDPIPWPENKE